MRSVGAAFGIVLVLAALGLAADRREVVVREGAVEPRLLRVLTGDRVEFINGTRGAVHIEFSGDAREQHVVEVPARGPITATFHRPGTHAYVVHVYDGRRRTLGGVVEVVEDETHRWDRSTCGALVEGICLEP